MNYKDLVLLVENEMIGEASRQNAGFFACNSPGDCFRKIKKYFKDREEQDVLAKDFDKTVAEETKAGNIDQEAFLEAWNQLVDAGDMWHTGTGNKKAYSYTPVELENALKIISKDYAYDVSGNNIFTRHETDEERDKALTDLGKKLAKLGFEYSLQGGGSKGRLQLTSDGRAGVFVYFKWAKGSERGGAKAAAAGMGKETELADKIIGAIGGDPAELSQFIKTAGAGHGSDLQINLPGEEPLNIEVKTSIGADFGQFKFGYDMKKKKWVPYKTPAWYKGKDEKTGELIPDKTKQQLFMDIWNNQVLPQLPKDPFKGIDIAKSPLNITKDGLIKGIHTSPTTSKLKNELARRWFGGKESVNADYKIDELAKYYSDKGDGYIQISRDGLYGLTDAHKKALGLDYTFLEAMKEGSVQAKVRIRIKAHYGANQTHSFTAALKVGGSLAKSNMDLDTPEGIEKLVTILQTQKEHLTSAPLTAKMLSEMIQNLMGEE